MPKVGAIDVELGKDCASSANRTISARSVWHAKSASYFSRCRNMRPGVNRISCARLLKILSVLNISLVDFFAGICVDEKVLVSDAELCLVRGFRRKDENVRRAILTLLQ